MQTGICGKYSFDYYILELIIIILSLFAFSILKIRQTGLTNRWYNEHVTPDPCDVMAKPPEGGRPITIEDMFIVFVIIGIGMGLSFSILVLEHCLTFVCSRRKLKEYF